MVRQMNSLVGCKGGEPSPGRGASPARSPSCQSSDVPCCYRDAEATPPPGRGASPAGGPCISACLQKRKRRSAQCGLVLLCGCPSEPVFARQCPVVHGERGEAGERKNEWRGREREEKRFASRGRWNKYSAQISRRGARKDLFEVLPLHGCIGFGLGLGPALGLALCSDLGFGLGASFCRAATAAPSPGLSLGTHRLG